MDIVICFIKRDADILIKNIEYINKNINYKQMFLISNINGIEYVKKKLHKSLNVSFINEETLIPELNFLQIKHYIEEYIPWCHNTSWYFQQFLKLSFAFTNYGDSDDYLVWDSDTIPINKLNFSLNDKILISPKKEYHEEYFVTIKKLLSINRAQHYSFISEHMLFNRRYVKEMCSMMEKNGKFWLEACFYAMSFNKKYEDDHLFSEFETYGTFLSAFYKESFIERKLDTLRTAGFMFGRGVSCKQLSMLSYDFDTVSFEWWHLPGFPRCLNDINQLKYYYKFRLNSFARKVKNHLKK